MRVEERAGWLLAAPYTLFLAVFALYPIAFALALVFMHWDLVTTPAFAGADNVRLLAGDARFWRAVGNTFVFLAIHVPLQVATALALALALNRRLAFRAFWRASFFLPVVISGAVVAILWSNLYATDVGLINRLLAKLGVAPVPWLTDPRTAMPAIAVMVTWKNVGFYVIIYLAGLQNIPRSCQEAIAIEGASAWQRFRYLTLPSLLPQTILVLTLSTINGFQLFIEPYVMTGGGPLRRTYSVVLYLYTNAFAYQKMGYAATIGVALALIIGAVVAIQRQLVGRAEAS
ncbi:MAG: ABC-type transporter, integral rane subunit [Gemmatimonadetes bacterium]|jgi:multiple sugar transport system permease protein|nr:ABC-type transporter, integral rane subunit [Gemmatimonadota bacterium]